MTYAFLFVNYNMGVLLANCIKHLAAQFDPDDRFVFIVGDNSSDPSTRLQMDSFQPAVGNRIRYSILKNTTGRWIESLNRLLPLIDSDYVVIMHPDVELKAGCIAYMRTFMDRHPRAGVVAPDLYYPNGQPCRIRIRFPSLSAAAKQVFNIFPQALFHRSWMVDEMLWNRRGDAEVDMVMSVCMFVRRQVIEEMGRYDSRLSSYYGNDYLCGIARKNGWTCHYLINAQAIHYERYTPRTLYSSANIMDYKASPIPAQAKLRADYFVFLSSFYPAWKVFVFRVCAFLQDSLELIVQFREPVRRKDQIRQLWKSVLVCCGRTL